MLNIRISVFVHSPNPIFVYTQVGLIKDLIPSCSLDIRGFNLIVDIRGFSEELILAHWRQEDGEVLNIRAVVEVEKDSGWENVISLSGGRIQSIKKLGSSKDRTVTFKFTVVELGAESVSSSSYDLIIVQDKEVKHNLWVDNSVAEHFRLLHNKYANSDNTVVLGVLKELGVDVSKEYGYSLRPNNQVLEEDCDIELSTLFTNSVNMHVRSIYDTALH